MSKGTHFVARIGDLPSSNNLAPLISIVTPSLNQANYLEETIQSVLDQGYPNLEYVIIDGGSTDCSVDIIRKYEHKLAHWVSEPDQGMYDAINKGFTHTTGEIMAWINSDDKYVLWAFNVVAEVFSLFPEIEWLTGLYHLVWDKQGRAVQCFHRRGFNRTSFFKGENLPGREWYATKFIGQDSTFWRRSLWERAGGRVDPSLNHAGDFELWARFFQHADLYGLETILAGYRSHGDQKTTNYLDEYYLEAESVIEKYGGRVHGRWGSYFRKRWLKYLPKQISKRLNLIHPKYRIVFEKDHWCIQRIW